MPTDYPTNLDSLTNPDGADYEDSETVPHAGQHANSNDAIEALQTKLGIDSSADTNSIDYFLKHASGTFESHNHSNNGAQIVTAGIANDAVTQAKAGNLGKMVDHQNLDGTDNTLSNQRMCRGIGYIQGDGTDSMETTITFPITFDDITDMATYVSFLGARNTSGGVPTDIGDFTTTYGVAMNIATDDVTTSNMVVALDTTSTNFGTNYYFGFSWFVVGTKS